ncbi:MULTISPECIES: SigE family RNA polymerase sigma factor [unclassified Nocardioides]|uniref:SigE family RNA polymerase sigma factor n=1 Tax=unclassified Nocardioides TaxID=2615069 RepID=UPI00266548A9|nr:SigE family RNA polymerase sigma factor [Nocardioides sp. Arc9.136]WKN46976.1 SigE family RNA polymerase sigma factor [Nocardioides sp. Arc9.136]
MRVRGRDDTEFTEFVVLHSDRLYRSAYLLTTSPHAAEDLLQTTLAKAFAGWRRLRTADDPVAYCHRILLNTFLSDRRLRRSGELPVGELPGRDAAGTATPSADVADRVTLMAALAELAPLDRAVVVLRFWHDASVATTAAHLHLTESAVKNRTGRALRRLRDLLADDIDLPRSTS